MKWIQWFVCVSLILSGVSCTAKNGMYRPVRKSTDRASTTQTLVYWVSDSKGDSGSSIQLRSLGFFTPPGSPERALVLRLFLDNHSRDTWKVISLKQVIRFSVPGKVGEEREVGASFGRLGSEREIQSGPTQHIDFIFMLPDMIRSPADLPEFTFSGEIQLVDGPFSFSRRFIQDSSQPDHPVGNSLFWEEQLQKNKQQAPSYGSPQGGAQF
jgi:hypothetical protein